MSLWRNWNDGYDWGNDPEIAKLVRLAKCYNSATYMGLWDMKENITITMYRVQSRIFGNYVMIVIKMLANTNLSL